MHSRISVTVYWASIALALGLLIKGASDLLVVDRAPRDSWFCIVWWMALAVAVFACGWLFRYLFGTDAPSWNIEHDL
jgi:hypothetical protein